MAVIQELPPHLADLIAAGEVVERPASAVKEIIENAIDAGSTRVTIDMENGGTTYLRISDNGCGMSPEDAAIAFRRHATSKLRSEKDLAAIGTLGFRGEALAAISAVSRIDLFTKQEGTIAGIHMRLEAGTIVEQEDVGCPDGTTLIIRDLFYNTPARMKFLKRDFTEANYVAEVVEHAALSHPEIAFILTRDGNLIFSTSGDGQLKTPVFSVFGREMFQDMMEVPPFEREQMTAWGYITKPHCARANRRMQHFFVNGRYVKSRLMQAALEQAYKNAIITGKYPSGAVFLTLPFHMVDVNVHPAKTEVKFAMEKPVFEVIYIACKNALEAGDNVPLVQQKHLSHEDHLTQEQQLLEIPPQEMLPPEDPLPPKEPLPEAAAEEAPPPEKASMEALLLEEPAEPLQAEEPVLLEAAPAEQETFEEADEDPSGFRPIIECDTGDEGLHLCASPPVWYQSDDSQNDEMPTRPEALQRQITENRPQRLSFTGGARVLGEGFHTYLIAEEGDGLVLIDKHAAHERIIFNRLRAAVDMPSQTLLAPVIAELTPTLTAALTEGIEQVRSLGFDIEPFGMGSFAVRAVPAYLDAGDVTSVLTEIAEKLDNHRTPTPDRLDDLIHTVSCKAAIKAGSHSSLQELQSLCDQVMNDPDVRSCPHGRPTMVRLTKYELDKLFKRVNQ